LEVGNLFPKESEYSWRNTEWDFSGDIGQCTRGHEGGTCIQSTLESIEPTGGGEARLKTKIDLTKISGDKKKIVYISCKGLFTPFNWFGELKGGIEIYGDGELVWSGRITYGKDRFELNEWKVDIDITGYRTLDVKIWHWARCWVGAVEIHTARPRIVIWYNAYSPPERYDLRVRVVDKETDNPISRARVTLLKGDELIDEGTTDGGEILFKGIVENGYTVKVVHPDYYDAEGFVRLDADKYIIIRMIRKPTWWERLIDWLAGNWWWFGAGIIFLVIMFAAPEMIKEFGRMVRGGVKGVFAMFRGEKGVGGKKK